jgi:hypothetical protein
LRTEVAEREMPRPLSSPTIRLYPQCGVLHSEMYDQLEERVLDRRPAGPPVRVGPPAGDELPVPAKQRLRLEREDRPSRSRERAAQRRQQRTIRSCQSRSRTLSAEDRQLVAEDKDLQLL